MANALKVALGGKAVVCCLHDREKRRVVTERQVFELGREVDHVYVPLRHKLHLCACCENLFVDPSTEPRFCSVCRRLPVHEPAGALPEPKGVVG